jgi:hypothetical protein
LKLLTIDRLKREVDIELGDECGIFDYIKEDFFNNVAHRSNSGKIYWNSSLGKYLSDKTKVYALNNSQQGIYTIGDIRNKINNQ